MLRVSAALVLVLAAASWASEPKRSPLEPRVSAERGFNTSQLVDWALTAQDAKVDQVLDQIAATGSRVHRLFVLWGRVQPSGPGDWQWAAYDRVIQAAQARHLRLILNPTGSPNWARAPERRVVDPSKRLAPFAIPDDHASWIAFNRALAQRYPQAVGFEIWNEEDSLAFWDATPTAQSPSGAAYKTLYCEAAGAIRSVLPGARVGVGGLAAETGTSRPSHVRASELLKEAYDAGIQACGVSFVGYHPYLFSAYCSGRDPKIAKTPGIRELRAVRAVMVAHGQAATPIWNTEWGFPSAAFPAGKGRCRYDQYRQASKIVTEYEYLRSLPYMRYQILFNAIDSYPDGPVSDPFEVIGVLERNGAPKSSFNAWRSLP